MGALEAQIALDHGAEFRRCLVDLDVDGIMKLQRRVSPHAACGSREEALHSLHMARTAAQSVPLRLRLYSDRWLRERGRGSLLPEHLRPRGFKVRG